MFRKRISDDRIDIEKTMQPNCDKRKANVMAKVNVKQADSKQLNRIKRMESYLGETALTVKELSLALEKYEKMEKKYYKLEDYYGSSAWLDDFEADEAGFIPSEIKRGVLSEDAVYNLIVEHKELMKRMQRAVLRSME